MQSGESGQAKGKRRLLRKIWRAGGLFAELCRYEAATLCAVILKCICPSYRHLWLLAERGREARDNAYHLFAYLAKEHPELKVCYVADPALPDYERVRALGSVVPYRSARHYILCAAAEVKISTHMLGYTPDIEKYYLLDKLHVVRGKKVFLQHGVFIHDIKWYHYPNVRTDLFVCTLPQEQSFIERTFGYPPGVVQRLGLCRFDALMQPHPRKRQILVMPTWRAYAVEGKSQAQFCESEYFRRWQALLCDARLLNLLEQYDYTLVFYPHYEVQRFLGSFRSPGSRVKLASLAEYDVQSLLMESQILITDYSSVQFDFAFLQKPVLYYPFDEERFYAAHYGRGYFCCRCDGFGPVETDLPSLLDRLQALLHSGDAMPAPYLARAEAAFASLKAQGCCERNYRAICKLLAKQPAPNRPEKEGERA